MSSTQRSKNSMEKGVLGLDDNEIQEELLNSDLKALGINEEDLSNMAIEEKQNLLTALKQSANPNHQEETNSHQNKKVSVNNHELQNTSSNSNQTSVDKNEIEIAVNSPEEYPSLPPPASANYVKRCNQQKQQQQKRLPPKKPNSAPHFAACTVNHESGDEDDDDDEDSGDEYISDDEPRFTIPGYIDDNGIKLNDRARKAPLVRSVQYYTLPGQTSKNAMQSMLKHYNAWYKAWSFIDKCNNVKSSSTSESNNVSKEVLINNDSSSPMLIQENNYLIKNEISNNDENTLRKSSSPDIEEVEVTEVKPADSSRSLSNVNPFSNSKRNNQARGEPRGQNSPTPSCSSSSSAIALGFKEKWDPETGQWSTPRPKEKWDPEAGQWSTPRSKDFQERSYDGKNQRSNKSAKKKDVQFAPKDYQKQEKKVQCPICQLNFSQSKVESHAAVCEGFPAETRSISPTSSPKLEESNSKGDCVNSDVVELTECNSDSKVMNKKRAADCEDRSTAKRICVDRL